MVVLELLQLDQNAFSVFTAPISDRAAERRRHHAHGRGLPDARPFRVLACCVKCQPP